MPFKSAADITVRGFSFPPEETPQSSWLCGLRVGTLERVVRVHGQRVWHPNWVEEEAGFLRPRVERRFLGWELQQAKPARAVSLSWRLAFGGTLQTPSKEALPREAPPIVFEKNPLGLGWFDPENAARDTDIHAPSLETGEAPVGPPDKLYEPCGFMPVPPAWKQRLQFAGTYDDAWLNSRHPLPPPDFDYRFYQCAPPGLIYDGYLNGGEEVQLACLHPFVRNIHSRVPQPRLTALVRYTDGRMRSRPLNCDGLHFDMIRKPATVHLTWRDWLPAEGIRVIDLDADNRAGVEHDALQAELAKSRPLDGFSPS